MAQNLIQFQAGLSLPEFIQRYGTHAQCEQALIQARWGAGFVCPRCGDHEWWTYRRGSRSLVQRGVSLNGARVSNEE